MNSDLVVFLRTRLDEDERTVRAATQGYWVWSREFVTPPGYHHRTVGPLEPGDAAYIAAWAPARALREIHAKRQIVDQYAEVTHNDTDDDYEYADGWANALGLAVRLLAQTYADHPDYLEEWKPCPSE